MEQLKLTSKTLSHLKGSQPIAIYWAGFYGKVCAAILKEHGIFASCYLAKTSGEENYNGLPVYSLEEFPFSADETVLIVAMDPYLMPRHLRKIQREKPFAQIMILDERDANAYCLNYEMEVFRQRGVQLQEETLDLGFVRLHNPMLECEAYQKAFALQAKDLILPQMGDSSWATEGPYTYGAVQLENQEIVLDCGANIGLFSACAAAQGCQVFSFEPHLETRLNFRLNQALYPDQIKLVPMAIGARHGLEQMFVYDQDWGANSIVLNLEASNKRLQTVKTVSVDEFVHSRSLPSVDFIKADIEGAERLLLSGAQETLQRYAPKLAICSYHLPDDRTVLSRLVRQGNPHYHIEFTDEKLFAWL